MIALYKYIKIIAYHVVAEYESTELLCINLQHIIIVPAIHALSVKFGGSVDHILPALPAAAKIAVLRHQHYH